METFTDVFSIILASFGAILGFYYLYVTEIKDEGVELKGLPLWKYLIWIFLFLFSGFVGFFVVAILAVFPVLLGGPTWSLLISEGLIFLFFCSFVYDGYKKRFSGTIKDFINEDRRAFIYFLSGLIGGTIITVLVTIIAR